MYEIHVKSSYVKDAHQYKLVNGFDVSLNVTNFNNLGIFTCCSINKSDKSYRRIILNQIVIPLNRTKSNHST